MLRCLLSLCLLLIGPVASGHAHVVRMLVQSKHALPSSRTGSSRYEEIKGLIYGELDPVSSRNDLIQDLALAPRNANGHVEYMSTFTLLAPSDPAQYSGFLVYEVVNRGAALWFRRISRRETSFSVAAGRETYPLALRASTEPMAKPSAFPLHTRPTARLSPVRSCSGFSISNRVYILFPRAQPAAMPHRGRHRYLWILIPRTPA